MNETQEKVQLKVFLTKAGSTELEDQGRIHGSLNLPLSEIGAEESAELAQIFAGLETNGIYSAACLSARQTATMIAGQCRKGKVRIEESWTNLDLGLWHGKCISELKENMPKVYRQWLEHPEKICPPNGETTRDAAARCRPAVDRILRKHRSGTIVVVAPQPLLGVLEALFQANQKTDAQFEVVQTV